MKTGMDLQGQGSKKGCENYILLFERKSGFGKLSGIAQPPNISKKSLIRPPHPLSPDL